MADKNEGTGLLAVASGRDRFSATRNYETQRRRNKTQKPTSKMDEADVKKLKIALAERKMKKMNKPEKMR